MTEIVMLALECGYRPIFAVVHLEKTAAAGFILARLPTGVFEDL